jgi:hypothetical protein
VPRRAGRLLPGVLVGIWLISQVLWAFPKEIADDWMGWRQADTQTIARNFLAPGANILYPRVNWGGDGPGYVETEFQLYTWLTAGVMRVVGLSELPGLFLSLLAMAGAGLVLRRMLATRFGAGPAMFGLAVFLGQRGPVFLSSTVQPDALCFLFYCVSIAALLAWIERPAAKSLVLMAVATTLAALVKVTSLHVGIFQFLAVLLVAPRLLRRPGLWLAWAGILAVVGLYMVHAHRLFMDYGNTFGIIAGGDSKFATVETLLDPGNYPSLVRLSVVWGFGVLGAAAAVFLAVTRRLDRVAIAVGLANFVYLLVAFRYTRSEWNGPHYHLFTAVLGTWLATAAFALLQGRLSRQGRARIWVPVACSVLCATLYSAQLARRHAPSLVLWEKNPAVAMGKALRTLAAPGSLVVVRSSADARDRAFGTVNNFEDPRVFYLADVHGWVLPADEARLDVIRLAADRGAAFYVDPYRRHDGGELDRWLADHADIAIDRGELGRIFRLRQPGAPGAAPLTEPGG